MLSHDPDTRLERILGKINTTIDTINQTVDFQADMPKNRIEWIKQFRPYVGGIKRNFDWEPFWIDVYEDDHPNICVSNGRQTFKSTFATDITAHGATAYPHREVAYVVDNDIRASAFSKQRLRRDTFLNNPKLSQYLPFSRQANIREFALRNGSIVYIRTDEREYSNVEGLTLHEIVFDECQYQDLQFLSHALYTMTQTKGQAHFLGIGGEAGSPWHDMWSKSDQREWVFKDKNWRDKLRFDNEGNLINEHPENIVAGRWVAQRPENHQYRGYHMPQTIFARIPLTIQDAIEKYHTRPNNSIEHQQKNYPKSMYLTHTLGEFYRAVRRPITPEMVHACMEPYRYLSLLSLEEIAELKQIFGNEIRVLGGVDFGSNPAASSTYASIIIHWRKSHRYQLAWIKNVSDLYPNKMHDQARFISESFNLANIDMAVSDIGYGQEQIPIIQDGGFDSKGHEFAGLGKSRFKACQTYGDPTKPDMEIKEEIDEKGKAVAHFRIDKTTTIQKFVDFIEWQVTHELYPDNEKFARPKLMIPYANDYDVDFLVTDFCATTRKDLDAAEDIGKEDPRQKAKKEFNHPRDSMMSVIYCLVADENFDSDSGRILGVRKRR